MILDTRLAANLMVFHFYFIFISYLYNLSFLLAHFSMRVKAYLNILEGY